MESDRVDALTMVPGIMGAHWLAWTSDDFIFKISVLSWVWCCACSMVYHWNRCDPTLLHADLRSQWVSHAFLVLSTRRPSWPIVVAGVLPVNTRARQVLNGLSGLWFASHMWASTVWVLLAYSLYLGQFPLKNPWMHSAFHMCLHASGAAVARDYVTKYHVPISGKWAYVVEAVGLLILLPPRVVWRATHNLATLLGRHQSGKN